MSEVPLYASANLLWFDSNAPIEDHPLDTRLQA